MNNATEIPLVRRSPCCIKAYHDGVWAAFNLIENYLLQIGKNVESIEGLKSALLEAGQKEGQDERGANPHAGHRRKRYSFGGFSCHA